MAATALLPSLSQIEEWDTAHLQAAASYWTTTAQTWEDAFTAVYRQAPSPGGTPWEGEAANAALLRVGSDRLTALGAVDTLHQAASIARSGASEIQAARQIVLHAVNEAQAASFRVGEDLSVSSQVGGTPALQAARRAQAEALVGKIRSRAAALAAVDEQIASRITAATSSLRGIQFAPNPVVPEKKPSIQALDNRKFPQEPPPDPHRPIKSGQDVKEVLNSLTPGRRDGVVTLPTADDIQHMFDHLTRNSAEAPQSTYPGISRLLPDGTRISLRNSSGWGGPKSWRRTCRRSAASTP